ncbi:hypothetical protein HELRODRAFT_183558 [Helobdella robusta]|uniref:Uncharacterized protein n=1 Tax=Helobdella robusta TaxID=6412 RepID=T1FJU5_HELRO|nr:hypothetical protein HELRODRAFT_183558 [Helobdella robusta]ESO10526.1 hypothetical protein HELRODRAFT_183558 [Helobdella robusta]
MRILASTDTMAPDSTNTINSLKDKHPPAPLDRKPSPNKESTSVTVNPQQIMLCLRQFPKGTSGGRDGLTPQHLRDLTHDKIETAELISAMTDFINLLLSGVCPPEVVPYLFGGRLVALIEMNDLKFLGSIVCRGKRHDNFWAEKLKDFKHIMSMMTEIGKHDALVLLTQAAFILRLSYFLRTSPGPSQQKSDEFNNELRMGFQKIFNVFFDDKGWKQAILPVNMGGLGLGVVAELAPSAFLSSAAATAALQDKILPMDVAYQDDLRLETFRRWCTVYGDIMDINVCSQKKWNEPSLNVSKSKLEELNDSPSDKARLMAVRSELGSAWLRVIPSTACGTRLDNGYRCLFGADVFQLGHHGLSCRLGSGRQARHSAMNDYICKLFQKADIPAVKEPAGLLSESNFRPDGYTLVPWSQGCCLSWDVTFPHTLAERYINYTAMEQGSAAVKAADFKNTKYKDLNDNTRVFVPICVETFGSVDKQTQLFFDNIATKIVEKSGDPNDKIYIKQNISLLLQKFNSFCILENIAKCPSVRDPVH